MADTKVYQGGIPSTFSAMQTLGTVNEAETSGVFGGPAGRPGTVKEGGATQGKTYDKSASENFLMGSGYKTDMEVAPRPTSMDIDNPDTISHADHCDDEDLPRK